AAVPRSLSFPEPVRTLPFPRLLPALGSALLLWLCFFPVAWGWLGWVALVPLFVLVRSDCSYFRVASCAFLGGLAFFVPVLQWMRVGDPTMYIAWMVASVVCALFLTAAVVLVRWIDRRTAVPLIV